MSHSSADTPGGSPSVGGLGRRALTSVFRLNIHGDPEGFLDFEVFLSLLSGQPYCGNHRLGLHTQLLSGVLA